MERNHYMMRLMIATYARKIKYYPIAPQTGMDTKNTKTVKPCVLIVQVFINVRKVKVM